MPATPAWLAAVEALLNRGIGSSERTQTLAQRLQGTAVRMEIDGLPPLRAAVIGAKLLLSAAGDPDERTDATIKGSPLALWRLAAGGAAQPTARSASAPAGAVVNGDAEIASAYQRLLADARPDFEEELSRFVGDVAARRLAVLAGGAAAWARKVRRTAAENIAEYLQEESRDLVGRCEIEEFLHGVDLAREAADRIEARVVRLERQLKGAS
jgi:ubiquinone biosynthesis protein UbiJ